MKVMSEGELKKRIQNVISGKHAENGVWYDKDVHNVLDEANQEFPFPKSENFDSNAGLRHDLLKISEWRKKWFGTP
jgi:hypothetical protein